MEAKKCHPLAYCMVMGLLALVALRWRELGFTGSFLFPPGNMTHTGEMIFNDVSILESAEIYQMT